MELDEFINKYMNTKIDFDGARLAFKLLQNILGTLKFKGGAK